MNSRLVWFTMALGTTLLGAACSGSGAGMSATSSSSGGSSGAGSSGAPSSSGSAFVDGSGSSSGPISPTYFIEGIHLMGVCPGTTCECLPQTLPVDATGQTSCRIFFELASGDTCNAHDLSAATPDVVASIVGQQGSPPAGPICVLPQVPSADWVDGSCATSLQAGWCYVTGAAAGECPQTIVTSPSGALPSGDFAILGCGDAPASSGSAPTSAASAGVACTPSIELSAAFGGFNYHEVTLDQGNASCNGGVCLVNHFQGLTSCPYGQDQNGNPPPGAPSGCTVPGTSMPVQPNLPVSGGGVAQTVDPWCTDRPSSQTVYCSCRCENAEGSTDDGASYCTCPSGYSCTQVVPAVQSGDPNAGAYCIKSGTAYDSNAVCPALCDPRSNPCP